MWNDYALIKHTIPRTSAWFERVYEHSDWLRGDRRLAALSMVTSTDLQSKPVPDPMWVERRFTAMLGAIATSTFADPEHARVLEIIDLGRLAVSFSVRPRATAGSSILP